MQKERAYSFYQWSIGDVERHFEVDSSVGLSDRIVKHRIDKFGINSLAGLKEVGALTILMRQFSNLFLWLLLTASAISYFVDGAIQSVIILLIVVANVFLGFVQEYKAEKALSELKKETAAKAKVVRDNKVVLVDSQKLVPGDVVVIENGDIIPADMRVVESNSLAANESSLTGESLPVEKDVEVLPLGTLLADQKNILFSGSTIVSGNGKGIVIATGVNTEFGKIAGLISEDEEKTPLELQVAYIAKVLTIIAIVIVAILFWLGFTRGYEILPLLTFVIALLVGVVPESLPTVITLALAIGISRMAKNKAIVRRMAAVETLGTVAVIATDKTGTLTNNKLTVEKIVTANLKTVEVEAISRTRQVKDLFESMLICSNVNYKSRELVGDPLEIGIATRAAQLKLKPQKFNKLMEIPFDSKNKYMAVLVKTNGKKELIVKGAPEKIAEFCSERKTAKQIIDLAEQLSKEGLKAVAVAKKVVDKNTFSSLHHLKFIGMVGMVDEPSEGVAEAIAKTIRANIRPIILTGDHPETARFVAKKIGLEISDEEVFTGKDMDNISSKDLKEALSKVKIFARVTPEDKITIVNKLEEMGFSVLVTGDGVNDAAAIKRASVGVAMGVKGTDVAKDSADIVLSDDQYSTIVSAIEYGRTVYDNIKNAVIFLISGNLAILAIVSLAFIFNLPMPILTIQILWINMVTDTMPAISLALEKPSPEVLLEKPRPSGNQSVKKSILYSVFLSIIGIVIGTFIYLFGVNDSPDKARTLLFNYIVFQEIIFGFSVRSKKRIWQSLKVFFGNMYLNFSLLGGLLLQLLIFIEPFRDIFGLVSLSQKEIILLVVSIVVTLFISELVRLRIDRKINQ